MAKGWELSRENSCWYVENYDVPGPSIILGPFRSKVDASFAAKQAEIGSYGDDIRDRLKAIA